jgi:hypothetical protein
MDTVRDQQVAQRSGSALNTTMWLQLFDTGTRDSRSPRAVAQGTVSTCRGYGGMNVGLLMK